ncbi:MAG: hypothetical protein JJU36_06095 [Phycisphaeraceae bacterium]|nr:hypothetical protein [Phycisphaeraceae bacterium]
MIRGQRERSMKLSGLRAGVVCLLMVGLLTGTAAASEAEGSANRNSDQDAASAASIPTAEVMALVNRINDEVEQARAAEARRRAEIEAANRVIRAMAIEAARGWRDEGDWPRRRADFARDWEGDPPTQEQLKRLLTQRLHDEPALDGYLRWQLLSFEPDVAEWDSAAQLALIRGMPRVIPPPQPNVGAMNQARREALARVDAPAQTRVEIRNSAMGDLSFGVPGGVQVAQERAFIGGFQPVPGTAAVQPEIRSVWSGTSLTVSGSISPDGRFVSLNLRIFRQELTELRQQVIRQGIPGVQFRSQVIQQLPSANGVRLAALMSDLNDRMQAGDPSWRGLVDKVVEEAQRVGADPQLSREARSELLDYARRLSRGRNTIVSDVRFENGQYAAVQTHIQLPRERYQEIVAALRG